MLKFYKKQKLFYLVDFVRVHERMDEKKMERE